MAVWDRVRQRVMYVNPVFPKKKSQNYLLNFEFKTVSLRGPKQILDQTILTILIGATLVTFKRLFQPLAI